MDIEWNSASRIGVGGVDLDGDGGQLHAADLLDDGPSPCPAATQDFSVADLCTIGEFPIAPREDQDLIGFGDQQKLLENCQEHQEAEAEAKPRAAELNEGVHRGHL